MAATVAEEYRAKWQQYRRQEWARWLLLVGIVPVLWASYTVHGLVGFPDSEVGEPSLLQLTHLPFAALYVIIALNNASRLLVWRCPRCGEPFHRSRTKWSVFARHCLHCQLPKWSEDPEQNVQLEPGFRSS